MLVGTVLVTMYVQSLGVGWQGPMEEAAGIMQRRFPVPRLVDCDQNGSQARFLLARLNPSSTYQSSSATSAEMIMTDDVSLSVFTEHLRKLAVQG